MPVYDRGYRRFEGELTPVWSRFMVPARYAFRQVFSSRLFLTFFVLCFGVPLWCALVIYVRNSLDVLDALDAMGLQLSELFKIDAQFFRIYLIPQGVAAFMLTLIVGPALISPDLRNNALPLYLCRPFSKIGYLMGKLTVLGVLLSLVTWVPGLLLFALQAYLAGWDWFTQNLRVAPALVVGSGVWILVLALLSLSFSALVQRKLLARILFLGLYFISTQMGVVLNLVYKTWKGSFLILDSLKSAIWDQLFGVTTSLSVMRDEGGEMLDTIPPLAAWLALAALCSLSFFILIRRVRAYEVVT